MDPARVLVVEQDERRVDVEALRPDELAVARRQLLAAQALRRLHDHQRARAGERGDEAESARRQLRRARDEKRGQMGGRGRLWRGARFGRVRVVARQLRARLTIPRRTARKHLDVIIFQSQEARVRRITTTTILRVPRR